MQSVDNRALGIRNVIHESWSAIPGVQRAVLLSAGGLVLCADPSTDTADAERLAALSSSLVSLTRAAAQAYGSGWVGAVVINMQRHHLCMAPVDSQTSLVVLCDADTDTGHVMYATSVLAGDIATLLDGTTREHLGRFFLQPG
ncbi:MULTISPECIES: roadblock/LC7 domain-containing protein [unclassified Streptomyces]|uniref:roadblock/LC7 domain-containing protein n=1 Tax=unclassified Streptomyces TaxID=2593676 RepID=UPI003801BF5C